MKRNPATTAVPSPSTGRRRTPRRTLLVLPLAAAAALGLLTACDLRDSMCMSNEYPVASIGSPAGGACVTKGEQPPEGYVLYPAGQVPKHVDDTWDTYWQDHALDAQGHLIKK